MVKCTSVFVVGAAATLVLVAVLGPIYAFVWASCISTRVCSFGVDLYNKGAYCAEGTGLRSEQMLHGEMCTVTCFDDASDPSSPQLACVDGTVEGLADLVCAHPVLYDSRPLAGGLVGGAITEGEARTACTRAQNLECNARSGGSAVFVQFTGFTNADCRTLFQECLLLNPEFEFMSLTIPENPLVNGGGEPLGTCTLGCFAEILPDEALLAIPWQERTEEETTIFGTTDDTNPENVCEDGPFCIDVTGSCNEEDNGDYYRFPTCASGFTQWVKVDRSRRIRYDGTPAFSQAGKWILEKGADPTLDSYGLTMARQGSFVTMPTFTETSWRVRCQTQADSLTVQEHFRVLKMKLGSCTCTNSQDCSGHGTAYGSKTDGPDCKCVCDRGYAGDHCETALCEAPFVADAETPACGQGEWLRPGQACETRCLDGFKPSYNSFVCGFDGEWATEAYTCAKMVEQDNVDSGVDAPTTTPLPECSAADCSYRGTATGVRLPGGTCQCLCLPEFDGPDCRGWVGECSAPLSRTIENSALLPCEEGLIVKGTKCTAQCKEGYWATPATLECRGSVLIPSTFRCIGGTNVREVWCSTMQYIAFGSSGLAVLGLLGICVCSGKGAPREVRSFFIGNQLVEVAEDKEGAYSVVRADNPEYVHKLPRAVVSTVAPASAVTADRPLALENAAQEGPLATRAGAVSAFAARQALERADLRRLACVAATEGAKFALEVGPLIPREYVLQLQDNPAADAGNGHERSLMAPALLAGSEFVPRSFPHGEGGAAYAGHLPGELGDEEGPRHGGELALYAVGGQGLAQRPETPPLPGPSGRFKPGQQVSLVGLLGHQALNGVQGLLVEFDYDMGAWVVRLEGFEDELKQVPEKHLQEIQLAVQDACESRSRWLFERQALEEKADAARQEYDRRVLAKRSGGGGAPTAEQTAALEAAAAERAEAEQALKQAFADGDAKALRSSVVVAKELLAKQSDCSAAERLVLTRLIETADSRLEQYDELEASRAAKREYAERVRSGQAPDWKITPKQFWKFAEEGNLCKVKAGLRAMQPLSTRSTDGMRFTIVHMACKTVCTDAVAGGEAAENRVAVVRALVQARANPNALDAWDRTPLEYALAEGGTEAASLDCVCSLVDLLKQEGLGSAAEAAESLRASNAATPVASAGGPAGGPRRAD